MLQGLCVGGNPFPLTRLEPICKFKLDDSIKRSIFCVVLHPLSCYFRAGLRGARQTARIKRWVIFLRGTIHGETKVEGTSHQQGMVQRLRDMCEFLPEKCFGT